MPSCPKTLRKLRTVWRRSKLKTRVWHSNHYRHIALLKRMHKQVEIGYSVLHKTVLHHSPRRSNYTITCYPQVQIIYCISSFVFTCFTKQTFSRFPRIKESFSRQKIWDCMSRYNFFELQEFCYSKKCALVNLAYITKKGLCYISAFKEVTSAALVTKIRKTPNIPQADSITDTWRYEIFFRSLFFALFMIMARIGAFAHRCNSRCGPYTSFVQLLALLFKSASQFKLASPNESASLLTEAKARSDYDVIEGKETTRCWRHWSADCYGGKLSIIE